jgi:hypothetical protein
VHKGAWRTFIVAILLLLIGVILGLVIAAMIQSYQSPNALEGWQSLLGSLLGALVTLFAGYLAWSAVRVQVEAESSAMQSQLNVIAVQAASDTREALLGRLALQKRRSETIQQAYFTELREAVRNVAIALGDGSATAEMLDDIKYTILHFNTKISSEVWTEKRDSQSLKGELAKITFTLDPVVDDLHTHLIGAKKKYNYDKLSDEEIEAQFKALSEKFSEGVTLFGNWFNSTTSVAFAEIDAIEARLAELDEFILKQGVFAAPKVA